MTSDHQPKKYHKSEILAICEECPNQFRKECVIADIEGSKEEYLPLPECMKLRPPNSSTNEKVRPLRPSQLKKTKSKGSQKKTKGKSSSTSSTLMTKVCPPQYEGVKITLTELDREIIELAADHNHCRAISRKLNRPRMTVQYRLNRMEKVGLIASNIGVNGTKIYKISAKVRPPLIHNETSPAAMAFSAHSMSFKFPILEGPQPKSSKAYKVNNWTGYVFDTDPEFVIRATPKNIIIDIRQDLGAGSVDELNLQYAQIAQSKAYSFAAKNGVTLGGISKYRSGHFTIEDSALGQIVAERGEFRTKSGIMIDKSKSKGDLEMEEKTAKAFEFTINKFPTIAANIEGEIGELRSDVTVKFDELNSDLQDIQMWLILDKENRALKEITQKQDEQIGLLKQQITQQDELQDLSKTKIEKDGMYG